MKLSKPRFAVRFRIGEPWPPLDNGAIELISRNLMFPSIEARQAMEVELWKAGQEIPESERHMAIAVRKLRGVPNPGAC